MTTGHRDIQLRQLQVMTELKTFEVSNLAWDTENAESRSLEGFLIRCISFCEFSEKSFTITQEKGKSVKNVFLKKAFL